MPWPWSSTSPQPKANDNDTSSSSSSPTPTPTPTASSPWHFLSPDVLLPAALMTTAILTGRHLYATYLRRIRGAGSISPRFWRRRSLLGRVTAVGDGDGFRLYHTPGGRWAGWGWFPGRRTIPPKSSKGSRSSPTKDTVSIRLAGVDAPEMAHFGRPAQPFSQEAYEFLTQYLLGRTVRAYVLKRDQYERAVATVYVRRFLFLRSDVGLELLRRGLATVYEGKTGAEFGGKEQQYREMEKWAKSKKKGMWGAKRGVLGLWRGKDAGHEGETPMQYKRRMAREEAAAAASEEGGKPLS